MSEAVARPASVMVCGEALVDLVPGTEPGSWHSVPGGGPANTAAALCRLGTPASLLCRLSADPFGRQVRAHLAASGVDLSLAVPAAQPTTVAVVNLDTRGAADYSFYVEGTADWQWSRAELPQTLPPGVVGVHVGSLAAVMPPGADVLRSWVRARAGEVWVMYDVNVRPRLLPDRGAYRSRVESWLRVASRVKASEEDLRWLYPDERPDEVAARWMRAYGLDLVLVTRGAAGAAALTPDGRWDADAYRVQVVDTVGAGDAFTAAYLHHTMAHGDAQVAGALRFAVAAAAITCTRRGALPPTVGEVRALIGDEDGRLAPTGPATV